MVIEHGQESTITFKRKAKVLVEGRGTFCRQSPAVAMGNENSY